MQNTQENQLPKTNDYATKFQQNRATPVTAKWSDIWQQNCTQNCSEIDVQMCNNERQNIYSKIQEKQGKSRNTKEVKTNNKCGKQENLEKLIIYKKTSKNET
jgi:hypothetical protein